VVAVCFCKIKVFSGGGGGEYMYVRYVWFWPTLCICLQLSANSVPHSPQALTVNFLQQAGQTMSAQAQRMQPFYTAIMTVSLRHTSSRLSPSHASLWLPFRTSFLGHTPPRINVCVTVHSHANIHPWSRWTHSHATSSLSLPQIITAVTMHHFLVAHRSMPHHHCHGHKLLRLSPCILFGCTPFHATSSLSLPQIITAVTMHHFLITVARIILATTAPRINTHHYSCVTTLQII